ncbi:MAG: hypothetical protein IPK17_21665 [Chloroflexi bacterium]|uniref:hypothetical protein n=1 Tax=Candidatus Flexifilum breve TaxID=3140694 RepID=UPI00313730BE|nr:hypothetical protein [Chloroflexota bacterium]
MRGRTPPPNATARASSSPMRRTPLIPNPVGLAISTFDALNHLPDADALPLFRLRVCRRSREGGVFIFDLNTRVGLQRWNNITLSETPEVTLISGASTTAATALVCASRASSARTTDPHPLRRTPTTRCSTSPIARPAGRYGLAAGLLPAPPDLQTPLADPNVRARARDRISLIFFEQSLL